VNANDLSQHVGDNSVDFIDIPIRLEDEKSANDDTPKSRLNKTMIESADKRKVGCSPLVVSETFLKIESAKKAPIKQQLIELRKKKLASIAAQMDNSFRIGKIDDEPQSARTEQTPSTSFLSSVVRYLDE